MRDLILTLVIVVIVASVVRGAVCTPQHPCEPVIMEYILGTYCTSPSFTTYGQCQ